MWKEEIGNNYETKVIFLVITLCNTNLYKLTKLYQFLQNGLDSWKTGWSDCAV